uniref:NYN domain-containing protein n=1 Tax=Noccaea caerulescens TaxID=107243 RepID=A0A1J3I3L9_NOCCA
MMQNKLPAMKAGVFWDTDSSCYFPEKYDPCQVRQIIESAFKDFLPLTISAIGDLKRIPHSFLEPILSNGIFAKHCDSAHINIMMDMNSWRDNNAPPATIILISDREDVFEASGVLPSLRDLDYKTIVKPWKDLFSDSAPCNETTSKVVEEIAWVCDICIGSGLTFAGESFGSLIRHFDSVEHIYLEYKRLPYSVLKKKLLICEEEEYEEEDSSSLPKPTGVWWDIDTCLVPIEVDPYQVRQCIDSALKNHLPFTISAIGNLERLSSDLLEPILSSGIFMRHGKDGAVDILKDIDRWALNHSPPATIILISDREEVFLTKGFLPSLSDKGYTIIRAFQQHPKVPPKYASQTILWDYLLSAGYEVTNQETISTEIKEECSETAWVCHICIDSGRTFAGESYDSLTRHFKSVEHRNQAKAITMAKSQSEVSTNVKNQSMASGNTSDIYLLMV